jgi:thiol-disulfide isomerase/thioredoxin
MSRKTTAALIFAALAAHAAAAQSGRRVSPPTAQAEPRVETPAPGHDAAPAVRAAPERVFLPESVLSRELQSLEKGSFRLSDFGGKVVVLNLWASWCGPCRREIPEFEEIRKDYEGRGVVFVGLTTENPQTDAERVKKFVREFKFGFRLGWADRQMALTLMNGANVIPQTFVLAGDGRIVRHMRGYAPGRNAERLRDALDQALTADAQGASDTR